MTDLLQCDLLNVDGRCYRAVYAAGGPPQPSTRQYDAQQGAAHDQWDEAGGLGRGGFDGGDEDEAMEAAVDISEEGGSFVARMSLDAELFPYLIGHQGRTRKRVEDDTGARITFPTRGAQAGPGASSAVVVRAPSRGSVARACTQLELLVSQQLNARGPRSLDYNHFLCLPLANPDTIARFEAFRDAVLAEPGAQAAGLEPSVFMKPQHLHLTLCMLKLYSDERRELARATLRALAPRVRELLAGPPEVRLRGLEYMNDDPSQMHVMYLGLKDAPGQPGSLDRLQQLCDTVVEAFGQAGLLLPQDERPTKLHGTLINTRYRRRASGTGCGSSSAQGRQGGGGGPREREQRQPIDGRGLLERHANLDLGTVRLPAVHLSQRGQYDEHTGFYLCADQLPLPGGP